ncbi:hypothetical protein HYX06_03090 [Candidatus Woesearchaeota archaeon]|nr:hypothetical protein [Candidatus Woesearchaeota archaeon]
MPKIFVDDGRKIAVETTDEAVRLLLYEVTDIFPALHYVESHPEARDGEIRVAQSDKKIVPADSQDVEYFRPDLIEDNAGNTYGYKNYNFVLLNSQLQHSVADIVKGFATFLSEIRNPRNRKVKIKDVDPAAFPSLLRTTRMKQEFGRGDLYYQIIGDGESPSTMFLYAERFSKGLRNRMGLSGKFPDSPLERRLYI